MINSNLTRIRFGRCRLTGILLIVALLLGCPAMVDTPKETNPPTKTEPPNDSDVSEFLTELAPFAEVNELEDIAIDDEVVLSAAKNEVLVYLQDDVSQQQFEAMSARIAEMGGEIAGAIGEIRTLQIRVPDGSSEWDVAKSLEASPGVISAGLNLEVAVPPNDPDPPDDTDDTAAARRVEGDTASVSGVGDTPMSSVSRAPDYPQFHGNGWIEQIGLDRAWRMSTGAASERAVIGIVDTGVPASQRIMAESRLTRYRLVVRTRLFGLIEKSRTVRVSDDDTYRGPGKGDHGLLVTCFAAGYSNGHRGVAWANHVVSIDVDLNRQHEGLLRKLRFRTVSDVQAAISGAIDKGADIVNVSIGPKISEQNKNLPSALSRIYIEWTTAYDGVVNEARRRDVLLVFAAGNDGYKTYDTPRRGPWKTHALMVAAVGTKNGESDFSNYGSAVDVAAPGEAVGCGERTGDGPKDFLTQGTSIAAPIVAGTAALVKSVKPSLTARELRSIILRTASRNVDLRHGTSHPRIQINACRAVQAVSPDIKPVFDSGQVDDQEYEVGVPIKPLSLPVGTGGNPICDLDQDVLRYRVLSSARLIHGGVEKE